MRPDQHKQKKSAQYKKKHGIQTKGNVEQERGKGGGAKGHGQRKGYSANWEKEGDRHDESKSTVADSVPAAKAPDEYEQGVGPAVIVPQKQFQRREVVSNWSRYEGLDESTREYEAQRGADFKTVLDATTGSLSQFRLQSERDWEIDTTAQEAGDDEGYLSINVADIAAAIQCIPLHTRLGLGEQLFGEDLVSNFNKDAANKQQIYESEPRRKLKCDPTVLEHYLPISTALDQTTNTVIKSSDDAQREEDSDEGCDVLEEILNLNTDATHSMQNQEVVSQNIDIDPRKHGVCDDRTDESIVNKQSVNSKMSEPKPHVVTSHVNVQKEEEELDFLLSLETPVKQSVNDTASVDSDSSDGKEAHKGSHNARLRPDGSKTANLEDWLDSMLDDDD